MKAIAGVEKAVTQVELPTWTLWIDLWPTLPAMTLLIAVSARLSYLLQA
jgi:hypothetical protein